MTRPNIDEIEKYLADPYTLIVSTAERALRDLIAYVRELEERLRMPDALDDMHTMWQEDKKRIAELEAKCSCKTTQNIGLQQDMYVAYARIAELEAEVERYGVEMVPCPDCYGDGITASMGCEGLPEPDLCATCEGERRVPLSVIIERELEADRRGEK